MDRKISICIPTYNRFEFTLQSFENVLDDERVSEIIISDDCSTDNSYNLLKNELENVSKVKLFRNNNNLDCYLNKKQSLMYATNPWCILLDSDNIIDKDYIDRLYKIRNWRWDTIYAPDFAKPNFNYKEYSGLIIDKYNIKTYLYMPMFECMLNTMNYFLNKDKYLQYYDNINPHTSDSIYQNYKWIEGSNRIHIVKDLEYIHRVHPKSHYILNQSKTGNFHQEVLKKIESL